MGKLLSEIWKDAVKQAESRLTGLDDSYWKTIQNFGSHDALIKDLEMRRMDTDCDKRSLDSKGEWKRFEERVDELHQNLTILNLYIDIAKSNPSPPALTKTSVTSGGVDQEFEKSMKHLKSSINTLNDLSEHHASSYSAIQQAKLERQRTMFSDPAYDEDPVEYPVTLLPQAVTNAVFYGRDEVLATIEDFFEEPASAPSLRSVLLHGTGGVGKTQTAMNFAHTRHERYDIILWIRSETPLSLSASMTEIARNLSFPGSESPGSDESNLSNFHKWLNKRAVRKMGRRWLLIYDNVQAIDDNLKRYIPTTLGDIILTSRDRCAAYQQTKLISLKPFSDEIGGQLLRQLLRSPETQLATDGDIEATTSLARMVDGLPLGIRHMAGLMNERDEQSASDFLKLCTEYPRNLMMEAAPAIDYDKDIVRSPGEEHPLDRIWTISFGSLEAPKRTLLGIASFLNPDRIQRYLFGPTALKEKPTGNLNSILSRVCGPHYRYIHLILDYRFDSAIVDLVNFALVDRNSDHFTIHRLVQDAFRYWCGKDEAYEHFTAAVHIVHQFFPRQVNGRAMHESWDKCRDLIQHGQVLAARFEELQTRFPELEAPAQLTELLRSCGWYLFEMADHPTTLKLLDTAIKACPDQQSETYAHLLNTIGCCSFELSYLTRCRQVWDQALAIRESWAKKSAPGAEEEWANQLNNYGNLESAEGNYESALSYFSRAKDIRLRLGNDAIVPLGVTYMTTGRTLFLMRKYEEAIAEYKKAEAIFLDKFGKDAHFMAQYVLPAYHQVTRIDR
ncbi:P-loop containing nucleoside triphosphate hydrolase protein [Chaetomium sp. MPI-CAGE-AT-0009]|nr:P-loop containing nucleoside triphosphate hydrolase protein [Chaetomium sp. MPI-CAGE-AT-0009]